jgi:hypothetical protein
VRRSLKIFIGLLKTYRHRKIKLRRILSCKLINLRHRFLKLEIKRLRLSKIYSRLSFWWVRKIEKLRKLKESLIDSHKPRALR